MSEDTPMKRCTKCGEEKPATTEFFSAQTSYKDSLQSHCRECRKRAQRTRASQNSVKTHEMIPGRNKYCPTCPEGEQWHPATPEYFNRNRTKNDGLQAQCKKCCSNYHTKYNNTFQGRMTKRVGGHSDRARKRGIAGKLTSPQIQELLKHQKCKCYYCNAKFEQRYLFHIEHTFPLSRVTKIDLPTNDIDYVVLACPTCNNRKHDKFPHEFFEGGKLL